MSKLEGIELEEYRERIRRETEEIRDVRDRLRGTRSCYNADEIKQHRAPKRRRCECCKQLISDEDYQKLDKAQQRIADLSKYGYDNRKLSFIELVCYQCFVKAEESGEIETLLGRHRKKPSERQEYNYGKDLESIRIEINLGMHKSILKFDK